MSKIYYDEMSDFEPTKAQEKMLKEAMKGSKHTVFQTSRHHGKSNIFYYLNKLAQTKSPKSKEEEI